jgi:asparagine synthase (glutamine-hydrolysing)
VLVVGSCLASDEELDRALPAAARGRWRSLAGPGSYLTVLSAAAETIVFGDLAGAVRVYFIAIDGGVLWSTSASALADYAGKSPNLDMLALHMAIAGIPPYGGATPFDGVEAVPPGYVLRLRDDSYRLEPWYEPLPQATFAETAAGMTGALIDGVARRAGLSAPITGDFGGTDSTILLALAALQTDAVGFTYLDNEQARGDLLHGERVSEALPRLRRQVLVRDPATDQFQGLDRPDQLLVPDLPSPFLLSQRHELRILHAARAAGSRHHMFGVGGDEALTAGPETLPDMLRAARVIGAIRAAVALARSDRSWPVPAIGALVSVATGSYEADLRRSARAIRSGAIDPDAQLTNWQLIRPAQPTLAAAWLTHGAAQWIGEQAERLAEQRQPWKNPAVARDMRLTNATALDLAGFHVLGRHEGLTLHSPWTDYGVLSSVHALASWGREPRGEFKALARHGLRGVVPPVVTELQAKDRMGVSQTLQYGRRSAAAAVRTIVDSSELVASGIFDPDAVWASVERWLTGAITGDRPIRMLLATELWLAQRRPFAWREAS